MLKSGKLFKYLTFIMMIMIMIISYMVLHTFNPSSQEAEEGKSLCVRTTWSAQCAPGQTGKNPLFKKICYYIYLFGRWCCMTWLSQWEEEKGLQKAVLTSTYTEDQMQITRFASKCLYLLSRLNTSVWQILCFTSIGLQKGRSSFTDDISVCFVCFWDRVLCSQGLSCFWDRP